MGFIKTIALVFVAWALDKGSLGRRKLLLSSYGLMALNLVLLALFITSGSKTWLVVGMFTYVVCFSLGVGPICWLYASEIMPTRLRARGMVLAAASNRIVASAISLSFLSVSDGTTSGGLPFYIFSFFCALMTWFIFTTCPETRGKKLEAMEAMFSAIAKRRKESSWKVILFSRVCEEDGSDTVELVSIDTRSENEVMLADA